MTRSNGMERRLPAAPTPERRRLISRIGDLIWRSDTQPTRFSLAFSAILLSVSSWTGGTDCAYIGCVYLELIAPWQWWATAWAVYGALAAWRVLEAESRTKIAWVVNAVGVWLFSSSAIVLTLARWPFTSLSVASVTLALGAMWVFVRTGTNPPVGYRGD